jgi:hypothetical protein
MTAIALYGQGEVGPSLDIVGIRLGMTVKEAAAARRAANPRLMLSPSTKALEGFSQPLLVSIVGTETVTPGADYSVARAGEVIELLFTTPPGPEVVWGIKRQYTFATRNSQTCKSRSTPCARSTVRNQFPQVRMPGT